MWRSASYLPVPHVKNDDDRDQWTIGGLLLLAGTES